MTHSEFDIQERLKIYFPILFELLDNNKIDWNKVEKTVKKKFEEYKSRQLKTGSKLIIEASFYSIVSSAINGEHGAIILLDYIQKLFEELADNLDSNEKKEIKKTIFDFLTNVDMKYLNFLGELSVLNQIKRRTIFKLVKTEEKLVRGNINGSRIDFKFLNTETNKEELIEIVNIHLNKKNTLDTDSIKNVLTQKINDKLYKTGILENQNFYLIPVLWGNWNEIEKVAKFYNSSKIIFQNTTTPVSFIPFTDQKGKMVQKFGSIDTFFKSN